VLSKNSPNQTISSWSGTMNHMQSHCKDDFHLLLRWAHNRDHAELIAPLDVICYTVWTCSSKATSIKLCFYVINYFLQLKLIVGAHTFTYYSEFLNGCKNSTKSDAEWFCTWTTVSCAIHSVTHKYLRYSRYVCYDIPTAALATPSSIISIASVQW